ncbi:MAG: sulfatase [Verrucomicrobia bacterium]|nr:sulfatase [Verrucomicrobiota bacterium]
MKRLFLLVLSAALASGALAASPRQPNIVFILADDLGWRDTSLYGSKFYQTPNIERLAARGMMFTQAYAASPLCSPTRSSIMTGLWPARIGITTPACHVQEEVFEEKLIPKGPRGSRALQAISVTRLKQEYFTLAEALKEAGYATGHFGKWHLGLEPFDPLHQGFDVDVPHTSGPGPSGGYLAPWKFPPKLNFQGQPGEHIEDRMASEAVKFLRANKDRRFFLNYWAFSVHSPWDAKKELIEKYLKRVDPKNPQRNPLYAAMVESLDDAVGTLLKTLDELGLAENTIIVFFSDNGGVTFPAANESKRTPLRPEFGSIPITSNTPLRGGKATIYEGGTREPCVVVWPGVVRAGAKSDAIIQSVDFYPTLLEMAGLKAREGLVFDGISFVPALRGQPLNREAIFCHFPHYVPIVSTVPSAYVRKGDWKLIRNFCDNDDQSDRLELYNLADDLGETNNLAAKMPEKAKDLNALLGKFLADSHAVVPKPNPDYRPLPPGARPAEGWISSKDADVMIKDNQLVITSTGGDAFVYTGGIPAGKGPFILEFRMKSDSKGKGQLLWSVTPQAQFARVRSVFFDVNHDGQWHDYVLKLPVAQAIKHLRLDPCAAPGEIRVEWLRLKDNADGVVAEWRFDAKKAK